MLKYYILLPTLFFVVTFSFCQERVVINNDVYITMDGGTGSTPIYLILDSPNANAMTTAGTGGVAAGVGTTFYRSKHIFALDAYR
jgi:hypothetical protein